MKCKSFSRGLFFFPRYFVDSRNQCLWAREKGFKNKKERKYGRRVWGKERRGGWIKKKGKEREWGEEMWNLQWEIFTFIHLTIDVCDLRNNNSGVSPQEVRSPQPLAKILLCSWGEYLFGTKHTSRVCVLISFFCVIVYKMDVISIHVMKFCYRFYLIDFWWGY